MARVDSRFYRGIQTKYSDDTVAVFFKMPSPRFYQLYSKQNINQIVDDKPIKEGQLELGSRVLIEFKPGITALGTVMGEYLTKNGNSSNYSGYRRRINGDKKCTNNCSTVVKNNSVANSDNQFNNESGLVNYTILLDESGYGLSVVNKTIWLLPVQRENKGNLAIL